MNGVREGPFWDRVAGKLPPPPGSALLGWQPIGQGTGASRLRFKQTSVF